MALQTRYADFLNHWEQLTNSLAASIGDTPHLDAPRQKLVSLLNEVKTLVVQQDFHAAEKQQATQRIQAAFNAGNKLAHFLRTGLKEHYGNRNEKLVEFGVQPFRSQKRAVKPTPPPEETPSPSANG